MSPRSKKSTNKIIEELCLKKFLKNISMAYLNYCKYKFILAFINQERRERNSILFIKLRKIIIYF